MHESGYSLADIGAMMGNRGYCDGFGMNGSWWVIILLFFVFGGGNWGNRNGVQAAELSQQFGESRILSKLDGISNGLCDGFYAQNTTMLTGQNTLGREIAGVGTQLQECCCSINRNIDAVRSEAYRNTCEITTALHEEGERTRALINQNTMQNLRDKLADRDRELQTANFQLSQQAQNATLISTLRPFPQPAYITCSPYTPSNGYGAYYNGCCGCGF